MTRYFRRLILGVLTLGTALVWAEDTPAVGIEGIVICVGSSGYTVNEYGTFSPEMLFDGEATTGWLEPNPFNANKEYFVWAELSVPYCPQTMVLTALPGWAEGRRPSKVAVSGRGLDGTTTELGVFNLAWQEGAATVELAASGYYTNLKIRFLERVGGTTTDTSRAFGLGEISFEGQRLPGSPSVPTAGDLVAADRPSGFSTTTCTTLGQKASALFDGITKFDNTAAAAADQRRWIVNFNDSTFNSNPIYFTVTLAKDDDDGEVGRLCGYELHMQVASSASPYDYEKRLPTEWDLYVSSKKSPTADDWTLVESRSELTISSYNFDSVNLHYSIGFDLASPVAVRSVKFVFKKGKSTTPSNGYLQLSEVVLNGYRTDGEVDDGLPTRTVCFATDHSLKASVTVKPLAAGVSAYDLYAICRGAGTAQTNVLATGATAAGSFACTFDELTPKTVYAIETRLVPAGETLETVDGEIIYAETREHYVTVPFPLARQDLSALSGDTARPQLHLTAPKGWINDPNGLSYYGGEWHVFCQHNPEDTTESWSKGRTCWQHFVSSDLAHWQPAGDAIRYYPQGTLPGAKTDGVNGGAAIAASGSAITDFDGAAGFGENVHVLAYTALSGPGGTGRLGQQCLAWSPDGRSYFNLADNPIMGPRDPNGSYRSDRDPKIVRYDDHWAMALYTEYAAHRNYEIFTSTNLKEWTPASRIDLGAHPGTVQAGWLIECPGLEKVKIEGEEGYAWVIWGGQATYCQVGEFDGETFTPYGEKQATGVRQSDGSIPFYAAQAFADEPNGRTLWIPWFKTSSSSVYSQSLGLPEVLTLERTAPGQNTFRMLRRPAPELQLLRKGAGLDLAEGTKSFTNPLAEVELACDVTASSVVTFNLHGLSGTYTHSTQKLTLNGSIYDWPIKNNRFSLTAYLDRGSAEVYSQDGRGGVIPLAGWNKSSDAFSCTATNASDPDFKVYELSSIWDWTPSAPTTAEFARQVLSGEFTAAALEADGELHRPDFGAELPVDIDYGTSDWTSPGVHTATLTPTDGVRWNDGSTAPKTFTLTITTPYHVTPEATGGGDGLSWATPMTFAEAMSAVGNGGVVWLKSGTYSVASAVSLAGDVSILGGFAGTEEKSEDRAPSGVSVIDAGGDKAIFSSVAPAAGEIFRLERVTLYRAKGYAIKKVSAGAVVLKECRLLNCRFPGKSGITVDKGNGTVSNSGSWSSGWSTDRMTGAILAANGSATFEDCSFEGCAPHEVSYASSAAVALAKVSPAVFTRCQFLTNFIETTASTGQGVALFTAWSKPTLAECEFRANRSLSERASTVSLFESGDTVVRNCLFVGNDATGSAASGKGRGILCFWTNKNAKYYQRRIENCTFAYNKGSSQQAALVFTEGEITVRNCIFWKNIRGVPSATNKGADIFADGADYETMKVKVEYCLFQGSGNDYYWYDNGGAAGSGLTVENTCLTGDPCFVTPTAEFETLFKVAPNTSPMTAATWPGYAAAMTLDCHLDEASPAIDAGDPASDHSREPNPNDERIDLGAYGNTEEAANYVTRPQVPADDIQDELAKLIITGRVNSCRFIIDTLPHKPVFPASELYDVAYSEGDWTAVGSYTVTLTLKTDEYTWADRTTEPRVFTVEIIRDPSELPPGVVRIPYIQGDGQTGYMLTGYHPNPTKDVLAAEVEFPNSVTEFKNHRTIWNTRIEDSQSAYTLHELCMEKSSDNGLENIYNSNQRNDQATRVKLSANTHYTFTGKKNTATVAAPGADAQTITAGSYLANFTATEMPLTLFAGRIGTAGTYNNFSNMRLYSFTVTDSTTGELIHHYIPVYDTNTGKAGVYDIGTQHDEQAALYGNFSYTLFDIAPIASVYYTGAAVTPALVITNFLTGAEIEDPTEFFEITYDNNVNPGTATVTITPKAGTVFAGMAAETKTFAILTRYYVTPEATGTGDGLTWETAFTMDQVLEAMTTGGEAWIKEGNYTLSASPSVKNLSSEYVLRGGFAGSETTLEERGTAAVSTISGGGSKAFLQLNTSNAGVTLERLVLTDFADAVLRRAGTGTVTLKKCRVLNAHYKNYGYNKSNVGGSFSTYSITMDTVVGAVLLDRGTAVFEDCSFEGISPSVDPKSNGGAVGLVNLTSATFTRCHFLTNSVMLGVGMGICLTAYASPVSFEGCTFRGNRGKAQRSCAIALINPGDSSFKNCLFTGNDVSGTASGGDYGGRGLIQWWGSPVNENVRLDIDLCTFAYNIGSAHQAVVAAQTVRVAVRNSIFYLNLRGATDVRSKGADIYVDSQKGEVNSYSTVTVDYSLFEGTGDDWCWRSTQGTAGALTLTNIVTGDPLFQTTAAEFKEIFGVSAGTSPYLTATWPGFEAAMTLDCHLTKHSPAVDAGDPAAEYANEPKPNGKRVNLGAYGNTSEARKTRRTATIFYLR